MHHLMQSEVLGNPVLFIKCVIYIKKIAIMEYPPFLFLNFYLFYDFYVKKIKI